MEGHVYLLFESLVEYQMLQGVLSGHACCSTTNNAGRTTMGRLEECEGSIQILYQLLPITAKLLAAKLPYGNQLKWEFVIYVGIQNMSVRNIPPNGFNRRKIIIDSKLWAFFWRDIGIVFSHEGRYLSLTKPDSFATKQRSRMGELKAPSSLAFCASWAACCARCVASFTQSWRRPIEKQPTRNMFCPENYTLEN